MAPVAIDDLRNHATVEQRLQRLRHMRGRNAEHARFLIVDHDLDLGNAHLPFNLQVDEPFDAGHSGLQLLGKIAQRV